MGEDIVIPQSSTTAGQPAGGIWPKLKPWLIRLLRVALVVGIFGWMLKPIYQKWDDPHVRGPILATNWWRFALAALMFAVFRFSFQAMIWRRILSGMGHPLPVRPAARIWAMSELARYLPGMIWQVMGRVYLSRPYGVSGAVSSASQLLELAIIMLANILVALVCLTAAGLRQIPADQGRWVIRALGVAIAFVPVLLVLIHPRVFYGLLNALLSKLHKPLITRRLPKRVLTGLLVWAIIGLLWQSLAVWILTSSTLGLPIGKWYVLAGAYCLGWTMGFSVGFLFPGGMGVRELVFVTTMQFALPDQWVTQNLHFSDPTLFVAFLGFLGVLLRLWATTGELTMAGVTYLADYGHRSR